MAAQMIGVMSTYPTDRSKLKMEKKMDKPVVQTIVVSVSYLVIFIYWAFPLGLSTR